MAIDPTVKQMTPEQRERWAWGFVVVLGLVAVALGLLTYAPQLFRTTAPTVDQALQGKLLEGDIIFQTSRSNQSKAIQLATGSPYSHCGLLFHAGPISKQWYVVEAVQPVKRTPLAQWIQHGEGGNYVVKRLLDPPDSMERNALRKAAEQFIGTNYDLYFGWSDERIYCSELVWKAYQQATGLQVGELRALGKFDISVPAVAKKLKERYGEQIPLDEPVISPAAIFDSPLLETVVAQ
jgi:hypothetical protein